MVCATKNNKVAEGHPTATKSWRCIPTPMRATQHQAKAWRATRGKESRVARRYQRGCVFKRGKREKVWICRWREDIVNPDGKPERIPHSVLLGPVSVITTKHDAQIVLADRLRQINVCQGPSRAPPQCDA